jgi:tRNA(fMet)-specific endonuclease VapC
MTLLDTDTLTLYFAAHPRVTEKVQAATEVPATSLVSRIEILRGRFDSVLKAEDGQQLLSAQERLAAAERGLARFNIVPFNAAAASEFDRLRQNRKLRAIGRADLLIASLALACRATLATRNLRHFRHVPGLRLENWAD